MQPAPGLARRLLAAIVVLLAVTAVGQASASASVPAPARPGAARFLDARDGQPAGPTTVRGARALHTTSSRSVVRVDPRTGTAVSALRLGGGLTRPSADGPVAIARAYLRRHAGDLGLSVEDAAALSAPKQVRAPGGLTILRFPQAVAGIPAFDHEVKLAVDRYGRVVTAGGSPLRDLQASATTPAIGPTMAMRKVARSIGARHVPRVTSAQGGARRVTRFAGGDLARLVLFDLQPGRASRLAWHVTYHDADRGAYDAVVDAASGRLLRRLELSSGMARASVFRLNPGAIRGGSQEAVDLEAPGWLAPGAATLSGPNAHAFSDVDGNRRAAASEEIGRSSADAFEYPFTPFDGRSDVVVDGASRCAPDATCAWNSDVPTSWQANRRQTTVQLFYYVNTFHDHLKAAPIGFDKASGNFEGDDRIQAYADSGAATGRNGTAPTGDSLNNAFMTTAIDGVPGRMQTYLGAYNTAPYGDSKAGELHDIALSDDARTVYHEYTHGMVARIVAAADGTPASFGWQASALNEAWADWYALDYLVREGLVADDPAVAGEVAYGDGTDARDNITRREPIDCPLGTTASRCVGAPGLARRTGGFTYADFGKVSGRVDDGQGLEDFHYESEIWSETLWDLRTALVAQAGTQAAGAEIAEALVTSGLRLGPAYPTFLDARNAIIQADAALYGGRYATLLWRTFAARGMGFYASTRDVNDVKPTSDFSLPPEPDVARGSIDGVVRDADTGRPVARARVAVAGLSTPGTTTAATRTGADGRYHLAGLPARTYPLVTVTGPPGYLPRDLRSVPVRVGGTTVRSLSIRRDWAFGAKITQRPKALGENCDGGSLVDGDPATAWFVDAPRRGGPLPSAILKLRRAVDVTAYAIDPSPGCDKWSGASLRTFKLESSRDGRHWTTEAKRSLTRFTDFTQLRPAKAGGRRVRYLRLTLYAPWNAEDDSIVISELAVFGRPR